MEALIFLLIVFFASPPLCAWYYFSVRKINLAIQKSAKAFASQNSELMVEKRKGEKLLHRMLPPSIAESLKKGDAVGAEKFESTTVNIPAVPSQSGGMCCGLISRSISRTLWVSLKFHQKAHHCRWWVSWITCTHTSTRSLIPMTCTKWKPSATHIWWAEVVKFHRKRTVDPAQPSVPAHHHWCFILQVVSGLPQRNGNSHADEIAALSLNLLGIVHVFKIPHLHGERLEIRIGLHSGKLRTKDGQIYEGPSTSSPLLLQVLY